MACRGVYFALTKEEEEKILNYSDDNSVIEFIQEEIEEKWDEEWLQETDKAWDAMHRCLTDGTLTCKGKNLLEKFVLGGKQMHMDSSYIVSYITNDEVKALSSAIAKITKNDMKKKYFSLKKKWLFIDLTDYDGPINEDDFNYTWDYFNMTREFFMKVANTDRSIIFTVDQ